MKIRIRLNIIKLLIISILFAILIWGYNSYNQKRSEFLGEEKTLTIGTHKRIFYTKTGSVENEGTLIAFGWQGSYAYDVANYITDATNLFKEVILPETLGKSGIEAKECCDKLRYSKGWNLGTDCCGYTNSENISDISYIEKVINSIDKKKIYLLGFDNGADFILKLMCEGNIKAENVFLFYNQPPQYFCPINNRLNNTQNITFFIKDYGKIKFWQYLADNKTSQNKTVYEINKLNKVFNLNSCVEKYDFSYLSETFEPQNPIKNYSQLLCKNNLTIKVFSLENSYSDIFFDANLRKEILQSLSNPTIEKNEPNH
jgi:hypothetical protein